MRRRKWRAELPRPERAEQRPETPPRSSNAPEGPGGALDGQRSVGSGSSSLLSDSVPGFSCGTGEEEEEVVEEVEEEAPEQPGLAAPERGDGDAGSRGAPEPVPRCEPVPGNGTRGRTSAGVAKRSRAPQSLGGTLGRGSPRSDLYNNDDDDDDDDDEEVVDAEESMEERKSVIMHLLSQVKLGMDLTKVALPTFILERRSLLEMYADFFAHPDLFVRIAEEPEARGRMVAVVRWFLSAFHAGRCGSIAKKPYNPVLGETFRCCWELPRSPAGSSSSPVVVPDGPVPWATRDQVAYVAEQVSHHPPISAFYAECYSRRIQFMAHIWTKSKFLGVSVGVQNIGRGYGQEEWAKNEPWPRAESCCRVAGCVSLLRQEEDYILTFPSGYGRSILTVPWVELGGECSVRCARSGFQASVTFHTKPFYGGRRHRVTADIYEPKEKKPFCSIEGEWNGVLFTKETNVPHGGGALFMDTRSLPTTKKKVRRVEEQQGNESRRLWREVTRSLRARDLEAATQAKHRVEERQRAEARERAASGAPWETRLFQKHGEHWEYASPLAKRLEATGQP
ncbi:oxysterol-binding protein-related protein 9-like isoform X1 [Lethenteron reissneri]|uniref:oxysterol-binding protein-related protein 9-like isoform X1 n=1 Tax=Lethenteron reissneri TaxID=7753 RepID=UPI002AB6A106|nr:oxysterol-binding protein-related protein 9-like isoform X1 [Lethenteron reissneri]